MGTEFDSIHGRGGDDGTPNRKTPWGEIAFQLSGEDGFSVVAEHEKKQVAPGGEVIRKFIPKDKACIILMDELLNYISRNRKSAYDATCAVGVKRNTNDIIKMCSKYFLILYTQAN